MLYNCYTNIKQGGDFIKKLVGVRLDVDLIEKIEKLRQLRIKLTGREISLSEMYRLVMDEGYDQMISQLQRIERQAIKINNADANNYKNKNKEMQLGRNDKCSCKSGKKVKDCHGYGS